MSIGIMSPERKKAASECWKSRWHVVEREPVEEGSEERGRPIRYMPLTDAEMVELVSTGRVNIEKRGAAE